MLAEKGTNVFYKADRLEVLRESIRSSDFSEEDRSGKRNQMCELTYGGGTEEKNVMVTAPLIAYTVLFGWTEELEKLLDLGFALDQDMKITVSIRSLDLFTGRVEEMHTIRITCALLNRIPDRELFAKCIERMDLANRNNEDARIAIQNVFLNEECVGLWDGRRDCLKDNLNFLLARFPDLFCGKVEFPQNSLQIGVETWQLLDIMSFFMGVYKGQETLQLTVLRYGRELLDYMDGKGNLFSLMTFPGKTKASAKWLEQGREQIRQIAAFCNTERLKRTFGRFWCRLALYLGIAADWQNGADGVQKLLADGREYLDEEILHAAITDFLKKRQVNVNGFCTGETKIFAVAAKTYRTVFGKKFACRMNVQSEHQFAKSIVENLIMKNIYLDGTFDPDLRKFLESIEFVYSGGEAEINALWDVVKTGNEELVRCCIKNNLISSRYAKKAAEALIAKENSGKNVPLLLLKQYEMI